MTSDTSHPDAPIEDRDLYLSFRLMKAKDYDGAEEHLKCGLNKAKENQNQALEGVYLSSLGVLEKLRKDYKKSYQYYQKAEKRLPDDHSLKIITASLLIYEFHQFETALRKLDKITSDANCDPSVWHHAKSLIAIASFLSGQKKKATEILKDVINQDFNQLRSASNLNYKVPEFFLQKNFETELCQSFLNKALQLAKSKNETVYQSVISDLLYQIQAHSTPEN